MISNIDKIYTKIGLSHKGSQPLVQKNLDRFGTNSYGIYFIHRF
jgi:hypothetical protein